MWIQRWVGCSVQVSRTTGKKLSLTLSEWKCFGGVLKEKAKPVLAS